MGAKRMRSKSKRSYRGFSLVELVIVIIIIGIIAAIAIPRVSRGSRGAGESALTSNLSVLRNAVELYASEHNGRYPGTKVDGTFDTTNGTFMDQMLKYSNDLGATVAVKDASHPFGPYLRKGVPPLPVSSKKGASGVDIDSTNSPPTVTSSTTAGWVYNPKTGDIIANSGDMDESGNTGFDEY